MKLNEIVIMNQQSLSNSGIDHTMFGKNGIKVGEMGNNSIMLYTATRPRGKENKKISLVNQDGTEIASIVGFFFKHNNSGNTFFKIGRIWTEPTYRNQGIMTTLRQFIKSKWHIQFMSDRDLTQDGLNTWRKVKNDWKVSIIDGLTGKIIPWTNQTEQELFVPEEDYNKVRGDIENPVYIKANQYFLISETFSIFNPNCTGIPSVAEGILKN